MARRAIAPASAPRRQGADCMERADDRGLCTRRPHDRRRRVYLRRRAEGRAFSCASTYASPRAQTLLRRYREGSSGVDAYAEDYAYLIFGLLELFQADGDPDWLEWATTLQRRQDELFCDAVDGGWFSTTGKDESVLLRLKDDYDGAEPAASSVSVMNLLVLSHLGAGGFSEQIDAHARRVRIAALAVRSGGADDAGCALHLSHRYAPAGHHRRPIGRRH